MAKTALEGNEVNTIGNLPQVGSVAPDFSLIKQDLSEVSLASYRGQKVILNIYVSVDTGICALSTVRFNKEVTGLENTHVICISKDLPFAFQRYCEAEKIGNLDTLSAYNDQNFGKDYGIEIVDGPLKGLFARAIVVIDEQGKVIHTELVPEITAEPDYDKALAAVRG